MTFDEASMREVVRQILEAQGVQATDQMIDPRHVDDGEPALSDCRRSPPT